MREINIEINEAGQRLDRFLRKYLDGAPLSYIYKAIRKNVKVNGKRRPAEFMIEEGDVVALYMSDKDIDRFHSGKHMGGAPGYTEDSSAPPIDIRYQDENILIVCKPAGLLTHGDSHEKKEHLTNLVIDYLISTGEYVPRVEKTFSPAPVNRLDRNTSGLVLFGKNYESLKAFNEFIRMRGRIHKIYRAIVAGEIKEELVLKGTMEKDEKRNKVTVKDSSADIPQGTQLMWEGFVGDGADMEPGAMLTIVRPLKCAKFAGRAYTLAEIEIVTGRTHQIRAQLAEAGHPVAGDPKYGDPAVNRTMRKSFGLTGQLLHAEKLEFGELPGGFFYLDGTAVTAEPPEIFKGIEKALFGNNEPGAKAGKHLGR